MIFIDIEATGLNVIKDRIIQIAMVKYSKDDKPNKELSLLINPGVLISEEAYGVHGISSAMVAKKPIFSQVADQIYDFIGTADFAGYNLNRFDIPILIEEFGRVGKELNMNKRKSIDVQRIFYKMEPRTLQAAHRFYTGEFMENAHDALADVKATAAVMMGQLKMYKDVDLIDNNGGIIKAPVQNDMQQLHEFTNDLKTIDGTQRLKYNIRGEIVFNFGKYNNQKVEDVFNKDPQYYNWIITKEFSIQVKNIVKKIRKQMDEKKKNNPQ
ncbi:MAG: 3'-5' exonuclease [Bacteroidota bacterium]